MNKRRHYSVCSFTSLIFSLMLVNCTYPGKTGNLPVSCSDHQIAKYDAKSTSWRCAGADGGSQQSRPQFVVKDGDGEPIGIAIQNRNMNRVVSVIREQDGLRLLLRITKADIGFEDTPPTLWFTTDDCSDGPWVRVTEVDSEKRSTFGSAFEFVVGLQGFSSEPPYRQTLFRVYRLADQTAKTITGIRVNRHSSVGVCEPSGPTEFDAWRMEVAIPNLIDIHPGPYTLERK